MRIYHAAPAVRTGGRIAIENVTAHVRSAVERSGIKEGIAVVSVPHTTCGMALNEDESGLRQDIQRLAARLLSPLAEEESFSHDCVDDNAQAHLTSILLGHSVTLPVSGAALVLGTWQSVFLIEMDGPRNRSLDIRILGE